MSDTTASDSTEHDGSYTDEEQEDGTRTVSHSEHHEGDGNYTDSDVSVTESKTEDNR